MDAKTAQSGHSKSPEVGDTLHRRSSPLMLANENCWKSLRSFVLALLRQKESLFPGRYSHDREAE